MQGRSTERLKLPECVPCWVEDEMKASTALQGHMGAAGALGAGKVLCLVL